MSTGPRMSIEQRPRRAAARTTDTDPADTDAADGGIDGDVEARPSRRRRGSRPRTVQTVLALVLAALLLTGGTLLVLTARATDTSAADNHALTDSEQTRRVVADVSDALAGIFTYAPDELAATERRAHDVLRGKAAKDYRVLFGKLRRQVGKQELSLTTQVARAGTVELAGDSARLLVFLDQRAKRKGAKATTAAAQLSVTARLDEGRWTITDIKAR
ncbi:hypothetical protein [Streptomyces sp. NPDC020607]|uniref:hypothetical protein n=1 Tax=Streptomyces sp. NPDC020607 TaxID=3365082 RepID=UPI0037A805B6